jgi:RNA polymerase sigma factor (sigma-70 family)
VAEDVVEDVFARLLERIQNGLRREFTAGYITGAVCRAALSWHRDRERRAEPSWRSVVAGNSSPVPTPSDDLEATLMHELVAEVRSELTSGQQTVFELVCLQGLSYAAAAEETNTTEGNVKNQLCRARRAFRELLACRGLRSMDDI